MWHLSLRRHDPAGSNLLNSGAQHSDPLEKAVERNAELRF
jgi:hypothetical protein